VTPSAVAQAQPGVTADPSGAHARHAQRAERQRTFRRPERTARTARAHQNGLGGRHLGIGLTFSGGFIAVFLLWRFAAQAADNPSPLPSLLAWVILIIATTLILMTVHRLSAEMLMQLVAAIRRARDDSDAPAVVFPSPTATFAATTLREYATPSSNVIQPIPLRSASSILVRPLSRWSVPVSLIRVDVVTVPLVIAAAAVIILKTEPGS